MGSVEVFEHTADVGLRIRGADLDEVFRLAAAGLFDYVVVNRDEVRPIEEEAVELEAASLPELLCDWLNELIFRCETRHRVYSQFDVRVAQGPRPALSGTIRGEPMDRDRHVLDHEVKAVTRHGLVLRGEEDGSWHAEVILDI